MLSTPLISVPLASNGTTNSTIRRSLTPEEADIVRPIIREALKRGFERYNAEVAASNAKVEAVNAKVEAVNAKVEAVNAKVEAVNAKVEAVNAKVVQIQQEKRNIIAEEFLKIFRISPPPRPDQINLLFSTYIGPSISIERDAITKKGCSRLVSMEGVIKYIQDNANDPRVKKCDFLHFNDKVQDIATLANYSAQPSCPIRGMRLINSTSLQEKEMLNKAIDARKASDPKRSLQVIYAEYPKQA